MAGRPEGSCSISLTAYAADVEIETLRHLCASGAYELMPQPTSIGPHLCMLFVGQGMAGQAFERLRKVPRSFDLIVASDDEILGYPDLLERCASALIAPYEEEALFECLQALDSEGEDSSLEVYENLVGRSPQIRELLRVMAAVARFDAPVLITGETGTGKELAARGIHYGSSRRDQPFVPVNCGALSDDLLLAELFGYEKGAFTDAKRAHRGLVAQAAGGVLFLDELDSLSPRGQAALLRFLQEQEYRPIGSETAHQGDVRIITATNKNMESLVAQGRFREDLYYRVHLLDVELPPLRVREGDVAVLAEYFLDDLSRRYDTPRKRLHPLTLKWMTQYDWPGNVRELQNYLYRLFVLSKGSIICVPNVKGSPLSWQGATPAAETEHVREFRHEKENAMREFERGYLQRVMKVAGGNVSLAARHAGKERRAFRRLLKKHGIDRQAFSVTQEES